MVVVVVVTGKKKMKNCVLACVCVRCMKWGKIKGANKMDFYRRGVGTHGGLPFTTRFSPFRKEGATHTHIQHTNTCSLGRHSRRAAYGVTPNSLLVVLRLRVYVPLEGRCTDLRTTRCVHRGGRKLPLVCAGGGDGEGTPRAPAKLKETAIGRTTTGQRTGRR